VRVGSARKKRKQDLKPALSAAFIGSPVSPQLVEPVVGEASYRLVARERNKREMGSEVSTTN
jgi:hypothetical protein